MRTFVTGASGFIGSAVVPELIAAGHQVVGLARSDASARAVTAAGADVLRGDLNDLDSLRRGAAASDGVIHLGFVHDFDNFEASIQTDRRAIAAMGEVLAGSNRPFVFASGALGVKPGQLATEDIPFNPAIHPRAANAAEAMKLADRGVRVSAVRLAPTVHGEGDHGLIRTLANVAREKRASGYIGDGSSRWPAVHRLDAAVLFRLALEKAPAAAIFHGVAEESISVRTIAEVIGRKLGVPTTSIAPESAAAHFGWLGRFLAMDQPASSALTQQQLGWTPRHPGLLADLEAGYYTD
jgi:nucleoside-diphosphate-sugar epimerase